MYHLYYISEVDQKGIDFLRNLFIIILFSALLLCVVLCVLYTVCLSIMCTKTYNWKIVKESDCMKMHIVMLLKTTFKKVRKKTTIG